MTSQAPKPRLQNRHPPSDFAQDMKEIGRSPHNLIVTFVIFIPSDFQVEKLFVLSYECVFIGEGAHRLLAV